MPHAKVKLAEAESQMLTACDDLRDLVPFNGNATTTGDFGA